MNMSMMYLSDGVASLGNWIIYGRSKGGLPEYPIFFYEVLVGARALHNMIADSKRSGSTGFYITLIG